MTRSTRITTLVVGLAVAAVVALTATGAFSRTGAADDGTAAPTPQATTSAPIESAAPIRTDLTAEVVRMRALDAKATQPGEVAGPAVAFTITLTNETEAAVDLSTAVVNATSGADEEPAYPLADGGKAFPSTLAAGASATGVFVFQLPEDQRDDVTVTVDTGTDDPVIAFTGGAPR